MPEDVLPPSEQGAADHEPAAVDRGSSVMSKLYIGLFLVAVVAVECAVAYVYIPTASQTAAMLGAASDAEGGTEAASATVEPTEGDLEDQVEVDLGKFSVTAFQPVSNTTLRIDFHLFGTVDADDQTQFEAEWQGNTHRFRDQVIGTMRACELTELTDAGLGLIKRKILEKTNRTLGKPLLQAVIFSDFSFIEQ